MGGLGWNSGVSFGLVQSFEVWADHRYWIVASLSIPFLGYSKIARFFFQFAKCPTSKIIIHCCFSCAVTFEDFSCPFCSSYKKAGVRIVQVATGFIELLCPFWVATKLWVIAGSQAGLAVSTGTASMFLRQLLIVDIIAIQILFYPLCPRLVTPKGYF